MGRLETSRNVSVVSFPACPGEGVVRSISAERADVDTCISVLVLEHTVGIPSNVEPDTEFPTVWGCERFSVPFRPKDLPICELGLVPWMSEKGM